MQLMVKCLSPSDNAADFWCQVGHRQEAIKLASDLLDREMQAETQSQEEDLLLSGMAVTFGGYVKEVLIQGAWMREYHEWEKATKSYFAANHARNGSPKPDWKAKLPSLGRVGSHVEKIEAQLALFGANVPFEAFSVIDINRDLINSAKHDNDYFVSEEEYRALVAAVKEFWDSLASQEMTLVR